MAEEIVIDTNVFLHAANPAEQRFRESVALCRELAGARSSSICVDEGFDLDPQANKSLIGGEYHARLPPGSIGAALVQRLGDEGRLVVRSRNVPDRERGMINQLIKNRRDRTFLRVAWNACDKLLVSHDYQDFASSKRHTIKKRLNVSVVEARECPHLA